MNVPYGTTYIWTYWSWNYRNRSTPLLAAHNLTAIAYQKLLLFVIAVEWRPMVLWYTPSLRYCIRFSADDTPFLPSMNPEEVQLLFAARIDLFDPISGQPTDTDLMQLRE